jgi:hypothetical protein
MISASENGCRSRAAAIREASKRGLAAEGFQAAAFGAKSEEFGVIGKPPDGPRNQVALSQFRPRSRNSFQSLSLYHRSKLLLCLVRCRIE